MKLLEQLKDQTHAKRTARASYIRLVNKAVESEDGALNDADLKTLSAAVAVLEYEPGQVDWDSGVLIQAKKLRAVIAANADTEKRLGKAAQVLNDFNARIRRECFEIGPVLEAESMALSKAFISLREAREDLGLLSQEESIYRELLGAGLIDPK